MCLLIRAPDPFEKIDKRGQVKHQQTRNDREPRKQPGRPATMLARSSIDQDWRVCTHFFRAPSLLYDIILGARNLLNTGFIPQESDNSHRFLETHFLETQQELRNQVPYRRLVKQDESAPIR